GTVLGTVTDSTGAVVSGAKVTVTNEGTGLAVTIKTDANGEYTAPQPPTGTSNRHLHTARRDGRLQGRGPLRDRRRGRSAHQGRCPAGGRCVDGVGHHRS